MIRCTKSGRGYESEDYGKIYKPANYNDYDKDSDSDKDSKDSDSDSYKPSPKPPPKMECIRGSIWMWFNDKIPGITCSNNSIYKLHKM